MSSFLGVPPKNCHRRPREAREKPNQAASGQRREVANREIAIACAKTSHAPDQNWRLHLAVLRTAAGMVNAGREQNQFSPLTETVHVRPRLRH